MSVALHWKSGRREFLRELEDTLERIYRNEIAGPASLVLGEIDAFELINDWYGYREADELLHRIQANLLNQLREISNARPGGFLLGNFSAGGFGILLYGELASATTVIAEALSAGMRGTFLLGGQPRDVTCSVGCTQPELRPNPDQLLAVARAALRKALDLGNARVEFGPRDSATALARSRLVGRDLQMAITHNQLRLEYQPIYNLERMTVEGVEALLRWEHPVLGLISPGEFIPIAARSACLGAIGDWVLEHACLDFSLLRRDEVLRDLRFVSVNVSRQNLGDRGLQAKVLSALAASGMEPAQLHLEITESELALNPDLAEATVRQIRALGVGFAIDDFGVGYSSLASLHQFPVDVLKLDRSFLARDFTGRQGRDFLAIAHAIINLARNVELKVIAEGVETLEQVALLQSMQCPLAQGYFLAMPMRPESLAAYCAGTAQLGEVVSTAAALLPTAEDRIFHRPAGRQS